MNTYSIFTLGKEKHMFYSNILEYFDESLGVEQYNVLSKLLLWARFGVSSVYAIDEVCDATVRLKLSRYIDRDKQTNYLNYSRDGLYATYDTSKIRVASKKLMPKNATVFLLKDSLEQLTYVDCHGDGTFLILMDAQFTPLAIVEKELDIYAKRKIQESLLKEKQLMPSNEVINYPKIPSSDRMYGELLQLQNISVWELVAYAFLQELISEKCIYGFAEYVYTHDKNSAYSDIAQEIVDRAGDNDANLGAIFEKQINYSQLNAEKTKLFDNVLIYLKTMACLIEENALEENVKREICVENKMLVYVKMEALKNIDMWQLVYFGFLHGFFDDEFIIDYAVYLLLKDSTIEDPFIIELAGLTRYETHKAPGMIDNKIKQDGINVHDQEIELSRLCFYVQLVMQLVKKKIL